MSDVIVPKAAPLHQRTRGTCVPIGPHVVAMSMGEVLIDDAPGITTTLVERENVPPSIGLIVYDPHPGAAGGHGFGLIAQLEPAIAREIGASLIGLANQLDPVKPS